MILSVVQDDRALVYARRCLTVADEWGSPNLRSLGLSALAYATEPDDPTSWLPEAASTPARR